MSKNTKKLLKKRFFSQKRFFFIFFEKKFAKSLHSIKIRSTFALQLVTTLNSKSTGGLAERLIAAVLKTALGNTNGGSNPSASAKKCHNFSSCGFFLI